MPRAHVVPRSHALSLDDVLPRIPPTVITCLSWTLALLLALALPAAPARSATELWLPTPPGEAWKIIQGYGCGTHNSWDRYSLDLANADGRTYGAPVRAAADGKIWAWTAKSGTLILEHGGGFYTMYTHMSRAVTTVLNKPIARGTVIGYVGDRGAPGTPQLHFTAFTGKGADAHGRRSVPLSFAEGYDLRDTGGCNQHGGKKLVAGEQFSATAAGVRFSSQAQPERWYNADQRVEFNLPGGAVGFSQAWDRDPEGDMPQFADAGAGFMQLAEAGEGLHTIQVRFWDAAGRQSVATYGPIGYDVTPPQSVAPAEPQTIAAGAAGIVRWAAASDNGAGVAGYRIYIGGDPNGASEWFTPAPETETPALEPGSYLLRVQPIDYAGNAGVWATVGKIDVTR